jgi:hypothetical protein
MLLQLSDCPTAFLTDIARQKRYFYLSGNIKSDLGTCLSAEGSDYQNRTKAITWTCSDSRDMVWDYYWRQSP